MYGWILPVQMSLSTGGLGQGQVMSAWWTYAESGNAAWRQEDSGVKCTWAACVHSLYGDWPEDWPTLC